MQHNYGDSYLFDQTNRFILLPQGPNKIFYIYKVVHEAFHGLDSYNLNFNIPQVPLVPLDVLIKLTHGKWRALSRAIAIGGKLYDGKPFNNINQELGELLIGYYQNDNNLTGLVDSTRYAFLLDAIQRANSASELGWQVFESIRNRNILPQGPFLSDYTVIVENNLVEVFAAMGSSTFENPGEYHNDTEVLAGITEILSAPRNAPADVNQIQRELNNL